MANQWTNKRASGFPRLSCLCFVTTKRRVVRGRLSSVVQARCTLPYVVQRSDHHASSPRRQRCSPPGGVIMPRKPNILSVAEFLELKGTQKGPLVIYFNEKQLANFTREAKPGRGKPPGKNLTLTLTEMPG